MFADQGRPGKMEEVLLGSQRRQVLTFYFLRVSSRFPISYKEFSRDNTLSESLLVNDGEIHHNLDVGRVV